MDPAPLHPPTPDVAHIMNDTRPSPILAALPHLCIIDNASAVTYF